MRFKSNSEVRLFTDRPPAQRHRCLGAPLPSTARDERVGRSAGAAAGVAGRPQRARLAASRHQHQPTRPDAEVIGRLSLQLETTRFSGPAESDLSGQTESDMSGQTESDMSGQTESDLSDPTKSDFLDTTELDLTQPNLA